MDTTANRLKRAIERKNIKQADLVEMTGIGKSAISQYLSGKVVPKQDKIFLLSQALDVNPAWLMGYEVPLENDNAVTPWQPSLSQKDKRDIAKEVESLIAGLNSDSALSFDGDDEIDETTRELLKKSLETTLENARLTAKAKYTPKKHRK